MERTVFMYTIHHISKRIRILLLTAILLLVALVIIDVTGLGRDSLAVAVPLKENTDLARAEFLSQYGWQISTVPIEVCDLTIPQEFDKVYTQYNDLQLAQGFDLTEYRGKTVKRYTYRVLNYPHDITDVRANLLVYDQTVIAGDICTAALDGFMHGLNQNDNGIALKTFYEVTES